MSKASTLVHYMRTAFEAAGLRWTSDNESEVTDIIEDLESQISDLGDEIDALRRQLPDKR